MRTFFLLILFPVLAAPNGASADALWSGPPGAAPMLRDPSLKVIRIDGDKLVYEFHGNQRPIDLSKITRLSVDNQPILNAAEDAMATAQFDVAVDNYQRLVRAPDAAAPWITTWAARQLQTAAEKSGRFDAAASAYIARVLSGDSNPAKPTLPAGRSTYLDTAANDLNGALISGSTLTDSQRIALLSFLVDVDRARQNSGAADDAANKLDEILARDPNNPGAAGAIARRKLQSAQAALDQKDYPKALADIDSGRALFNDPQQQADALFVIAEAKLGLAATATPDANRLKDAAVSYMRVVAHFKDAPDRPHVAQSLARVAQIFEALGDVPSARQTCEQIIQQFPDDPDVVAGARRNLQRLNQAAATTAPIAR